MMSSQQAMPVLESVDAQPSLYVRSYPRCNCGDRWLCDECRDTWIRRRARTTSKWLNDALAGGRAWAVLLTTPTTGHWLTELTELWDRWRALGRLRTLHRQRKTQGALTLIRRGVASAHLLSRTGDWQPHLHAVLVTEMECDELAIIDAWKAFGEGYADIEPVRKMGAAIRYAIAGSVERPLDDRVMLAELLPRVRMVRRIGK